MILTTYQCTTGNLLIDEIRKERLDEHVIEEEIYETQEAFSDVEDNLRAIGTHLYVIRCLYIASRYEDW